VQIREGKLEMKMIPDFAIPDEFKELFEEYAGILEHDASMSRRQAEDTALRMIYVQIEGQTSEQS
jgi:hypothetical protein